MRLGALGSSHGGRGGREREPALSPGGVQVDAAQDGGQFGGGDFQAVPLGLGEAEGAAFQAFGPEGVTVAVPVEDLEPIAATIDEDEEMSGERILTDDLLGHRGQAVEGAAHVGGLRAEVDTDGGREAEHQEGSPSRQSRSWRRQRGSKPGRTRMRQSQGRTSSKGTVGEEVPSWSLAWESSWARRWTGRKRGVVVVVLAAGTAKVCERARVALGGSPGRSW